MRVFVIDVGGTHVQEETDEFYGSIIPETLSADAKNIMRQALAGVLWSK
jgi:hypothetical protein